MCVCVSSVSGQDYRRARCYPKVAKSIGMTRGHAAGFRREIESPIFLRSTGSASAMMILCFSPSVINRDIIPGRLCARRLTLS